MFLAAVALVGTWAAARAEAVLGARDPGVIVIDEVAGMALAALLLPPTPRALAAAFALFRVFDVAKPPPARAAGRLPGGVGVVLDDLVAGAWTLAILLGLRAAVGLP